MFITTNLTFFKQHTLLNFFLKSFNSIKLSIEIYKISLASLTLKQRNSNLKVLQKELIMNRMSILCFVKRDNFCFLKISDSNLLFATFSNFPGILFFEFRVLLFSKMKPRIRTAHYHILALRLLIFFRNYLLNFVYIYLIFVIPNFIFFTKHNF